MMYNEKIKLEFIHQYSKAEATAKKLLRIFKAMESIESKHDADFFAMTGDQAQEVFYRVTSIGAEWANTTLSVLRAYVKWCTSKGYPVSGAVYSLRLDVYDKIKSQYVASPLHLLRSLNEAFPHPDENEIEYIYRSFLWLGFMGFQASDALSLKRNEVDFTTMHIHCSNSEEPFLIYSEALHDLRKAAELKTFREPRGKDGVVKQRVNGNKILRGKVTEKASHDVISGTIRPTISRAFSAALNVYETRGIPVPPGISLKLTFDRVYKSGIFYRAYEYERMRISPSFDAVMTIGRKKAKALEVSQGEHMDKRLHRIVIYGMERDYKNWKGVYT